MNAISLPLRSLLIAAGLGQLLLVAASVPLIPRLLHWPEELAKLRREPFESTNLSEFWSRR